mmetsp:Transcript_34449/g.78568  ORF Transcript_34449/g.78568 Transcript_34449/m.78568 type:complete len:405 (+) Transcript_34449:127-1341(+)
MTVTPRSIRAVLWGSPNGADVARGPHSAPRVSKPMSRPLSREGTSAAKGTMELAWKVLQAAESRRAIVLAEQERGMPLTVHTMQAKKVAYSRQRAVTQPRNYRIYGPSPPPVSYWPPTRSMIGGLDASSPPCWYDSNAELVQEAEPLLSAPDLATPTQILRGLGCISGMRVPTTLGQAVTLPSAGEKSSHEGLPRRGSSVGRSSALVVEPVATEGVVADRFEMAAPRAEEEYEPSIASASGRQRPGSAYSATRARVMPPTEASGTPSGAHGRGPRPAPLSIRGLQGVSVPSPHADRNRTSGRALLRRALSLPSARAAPATVAKSRPLPRSAPSAAVAVAPAPPASSCANTPAATPQPAKRRNKAGLSKRFVLPFAYCVDDPRLAHLDSTDGRTLPEFLTSDGHF